VILVSRPVHVAHAVEKPCDGCCRETIVLLVRLDVGEPYLRSSAETFACRARSSVSSRLALTYCGTKPARNTTISTMAAAMALFFHEAPLLVAYDQTEGAQLACSRKPLLQFAEIVVMCATWNRPHVRMRSEPKRRMVPPISQIHSLPHERY
jgi:hypothetical protein